MSTTPLPACTGCQGIILDLVRQAEGDDEPDEAQQVQETDLPRPSDLAAPVNKLWPNGQVFQVWFINGEEYPEHVALVKATVPEWEKYANVSFTFPLHWDPDSPPEVRIRFSGNGFWSYIGLDVRDKVAHDNQPNMRKPTMSLRPDDLSEEEVKVAYRGTILHEFGHTLGFMHEHQRPDGEFESPTTWTRSTSGTSRNINGI